MKESSLARYLSKFWPTEAHVSRIESETSPGFPDLHITYQSSSSTVELKQTKRPKAKYPFSGKDGLRKSQIDWIKDEANAGGRVLLALGCAEEILLLAADLYADCIDTMTLSDIRRVAIVSWEKRGEIPKAKIEDALLP